MAGLATVQENWKWKSEEASQDPFNQRKSNLVILLANMKEVLTRQQMQILQEGRALKHKKTKSFHARPTLLYA
jgi:hypothetical protein